MPFPHPTIGTIALRLSEGAATAVALAQQTFDAIGHHPDQAIFTVLTRDRAMREAQASDIRRRAGRSLGLLDGIPVAWKDLFALEGLATTAGSVVLAAAPPAREDAGVVKALAAAGMVSVGRVNMSEFAFSGLGVNPHYGTPRNPHSPDVPRVPGGSSSGSAVAVATGLVPVSIGTDTGGSVRIPAAFNGLVGYKATHGRYPMDGVFPLAKSLDSLGPLVRTVTDAIWVDAALRGRTAPDIGRRDLADFHFIIPETLVFDQVEAGVLAAFEAGIRRLERAGARIVRQAFPLYGEIAALTVRHGPLATAEAYAVHHERLAGPDAERMDHRVVARTRAGASVLALDYIRLLEGRARLLAQLRAALPSGTMLLQPTVAHVAPRTEPLVDDDALFVSTNIKTLSNTALGNFLDLCGVSLPCGIGEAAMPVGLQVAALGGEDEVLLSAALAVEQQLGF